MNGYATLGIALYLIIVSARGNQQKLVDLLADEKNFLKWIVALAAVKLTAKQLGETGDRFVIIVFIAMLITAISKDPKIFTGIADILKINQ